MDIATVSVDQFQPVAYDARTSYAENDISGATVLVFVPAERFAHKPVPLSSRMAVSGFNLLIATLR